jgi:hypothetical protein
MTWSERTNTEMPRASCFLQRPLANLWEANSIGDWFQDPLSLRMRTTTEIEPLVVLTPLGSLTWITKTVRI